ncbi:MAG: UDP-N-acetylmuramoyl-tripeptide--D-alanyl-D-alanine ligase [Bryobacteraceae bacterium]
MKLGIRIGIELEITTEPQAVATGWSVDSRTVAEGDLFFALKGPRHDGHDHVPEALRKGAVGVVVERPCGAGGWEFVVNDTLAALQGLAAEARIEWNGEVVGVTGSAGKTSTKDAIARLLETGLRVGKSEGNLNNHVGLPLSILRLPDECQAAVLEMGMNHSGEIRVLAGMARPDVAVVTNVGWAHTENFRSIDGVAAAKRELVESLGPDGVAVLNGDDERVAGFDAPRRILYGFGENADVRARNVEAGPEGARFEVDGVRFEIPQAGRHAVSNVLAGVAVARIFDLPLADLVEAARTLAAGAMRGQRMETRGITIWNDCYNSNPEAARSMIDVLAATPARRRVAVLGEMLELGRESERLHRETGRYARSRGIDAFVGIRGAARFMVEEASGAAYFFESPEEAGEFLRGFLREGDAVLFKGSRGVAVEKSLARVVEARD